MPGLIQDERTTFASMKMYVPLPGPHYHAELARNIQEVSVCRSFNARQQWTRIAGSLPGMTRCRSRLLGTG